MRVSVSVTILALTVGSLLLTESTARAAEPTRKRSACPSIDGDWSGDFDGSFSGTWSATFTEAGAMLSATATISLDAGNTFEGEGSGGVKCESGRTAVAGSASAHGKSGSFSGISDETGRKLSGTWWADELTGTWRGERVDH